MSGMKKLFETEKKISKNARIMVVDFFFFFHYCHFFFDLMCKHMVFTLDSFKNLIKIAGHIGECN